MIKMMAVVVAMIRSIVVWLSKEEMVMVGIRKVNTETPFITTGIDRTIEIIYLNKSAVLAII